MTEIKHTSTVGADLNDAQIFIAAAEAKTVVVAARKLHRPASSVSRAITRLEKRLGVKLAQRGPKGFVLTEVGAGYLDACRRAIRALNEGESWIEAQRSQPSGRLKVACTVTFAREIITPLLKTFLVQYPGLKVQVETYTSGAEITPSDDVDVFFEVRRGRDSSRTIRCFPGLALGLYASAEYVQQHGTPSTPAGLRTHACIGYGQWQLRRGDEVMSPQLVFTVETCDPQSQLTLVKQGLGIGVLPTLWAAHEAHAEQELVIVLPDWKLEPIGFCALFHGRKSQTPKVQALLDFLQQYIGTEKDPRIRTQWRSDFFPSAI